MTQESERKLSLPEGSGLQLSRSFHCVSWHYQRALKRKLTYSIFFLHIMEWKSCLVSFIWCQILYFPHTPLPPKMATAVGIVLFTFQRLAKLFESCPTLCNPMDCSPPGFSVHGLLQARILEWVAMPFTRGSSQPRDWTQVSYISSISRHILYQ